MISPATDMNDFARNMMKACEEMNAMFTGYMGAASRSNAAALQGFEDMARNVNGLMQESLARAVSVTKTIMTAKSPQEAADTHAEFMKDCFDGIVANGGKISEISLRAAKSTIEPISQHANVAMGSIMQKVKAA